MPRKSNLASLSIQDLTEEIQRRVRSELPALKKQRDALDRQIAEPVESPVSPIALPK